MDDSIKLKKMIAVRTSRTLYRENGKTYKVFNEDFKKSDVLAEALNHAKIEETGLNIPKIEGISIIDGKWTIVTEYIKGNTLQSLMDKRPEKEDEYLELFIQLQILVHSKWAPILNSLPEVLSRKISKSELDATTRYDLILRLDEMPKVMTICHGDFNPSNIVITDDDVPYILDWSSAAHGDPAADVANTYLLFLLSGEQARGEKYLNLICEKSAISRSHVKEWIPIIAAALSAEGTSEERKFLLEYMENK